MELQEILVSYCKNEKTAAMYHTYGGNVFEIPSGIGMSAGATLSFGTYFNAFSIGKWKKYTITNKYRVAFKGKGTVRIRLFHEYADGDSIRRIELSEKTANLQGEAVLRIDDEIMNGIVYPVIEAVTDSEIEYGCYLCECEGKAREDVSLALDICTFKREPYVIRNIKNLSENILLNEKCPMYKRAKVFISDNADTLGDALEQFEHVTVMPNENVGGVGGFTRGMIEALKDGRFTHVLIMDDDAVIEPSAIVKTYMFLKTLKKKYQGHTIGGQLLRENTPNIQYEAGAVWKRGKIKALHHHFDVTNTKQLVLNEEEQEIEYAGWWYCCIPVSEIKKEGLPLPLFIHRDDIEYGMRTGRNRFIYLNGVGVWHEAFENKMPGANEYYDWRNLAIINCIHYDDFSKRELFRFLFKWTTANVIRYRYKYVDMNIRGVEDFLKGIDWFSARDGQQLHGEILSMNYRAKPATEYVGYKGLGKEDVTWDNIEKVEPARPGAIRKILQLATFNGYIFPARKDRVLVAMPHDNIYDMYRQSEILYVDSNGNGLLLKRSIREAIKCYGKLFKLRKLINERFDAVKNEYEKRYTELTNMEFWSRYLKLDKEI